MRLALLLFFFCGLAAACLADERSMSFTIIEAREQAQRSINADTAYQAMVRAINITLQTATGHSATVEYPDECYLPETICESARFHWHFVFAVQHNRIGNASIDNLPRFLASGNRIFTISNNMPAMDDNGFRIRDYIRRAQESGYLADCTHRKDEECNALATRNDLKCRPFHQSCIRRIPQLLRSLGYTVDDSSSDSVNHHCAPLENHKYDPRVICRFTLSWDL